MRIELADLIVIAWHCNIDRQRADRPSEWRIDVVKLKVTVQPMSQSCREVGDLIRHGRMNVSTEAKHG
jgi:hypothetical protein